MSGTPPPPGRPSVNMGRGTKVIALVVVLSADKQARSKANSVSAKLRITRNSGHRIESKACQLKTRINGLNKR
jgi:hypothetical protein